MAKLQKIKDLVFSLYLLLDDIEALTGVSLCRCRRARRKIADESTDSPKLTLIKGGCDNEDATKQLIP